VTFRNSVAVASMVAIMAGCSGNYAAEEEGDVPQSGPIRERRAPPEDTVFAGTALGSGFGLLGDDEADGGALPVNKFLWQASLDTLSFLPLDSTDPFSGVIATEWAATPGNPDERLKVTVYLQRAALEASSLKVAVFREARNGEGLWVPQAVNPETPRKLEDAILTRARQIRIATLDEGEDAESAS